MQRYKNSVVLLIVILIVIAGGIVWYSKFKNRITKDNVVVTQVQSGDVSGIEDIISKFPSDMPIDKERVSQSSTANYVDHGDVLSSITYISAEDQGVLYEKYQKFMIDKGFVIDSKNSLKESGFIRGTKDDNTLSVTIGTSGAVRVVQLSYVDRK